MNAAARAALLVVSGLTLAAPLHAQVLQTESAPRRAPARAPSVVLTGLKKNLSLLVKAQEKFFADSARYALSVAELGFKPDEGTRLSILRADKAGWSARATSAGLSGKSCVIWVGPSQAAEPPSTNAMHVTGKQGEVACDNP